MIECWSLLWAVVKYFQELMYKLITVIVFFMQFHRISHQLGLETNWVNRTWIANIWQEKIPLVKLDSQRPYQSQEDAKGWLDIPKVKWTELAPRKISVNLRRDYLDYSAVLNTKSGGIDENLSAKINWGSCNHLLSGAQVSRSGTTWAQTLDSIQKKLLQPSYPTRIEVTNTITCYILGRWISIALPPSHGTFKMVTVQLNCTVSFTWHF